MEKKGTFFANFLENKAITYLNDSICNYFIIFSTKRQNKIARMLKITIFVSKPNVIY
jgi:uncharacterized membrane protein required for colicin V production